MSLYDIPRTAWEQPGYRISEHTNVGPVPREQLENIVIHYPGASRIGSDYLRRIAAGQRYYADQRGYSYGYNFVVTPDGDCVQVRGLDYRSAATAGANTTTVAIQIQQPIGEPANDAQVRRVRQLVADLRDWAGKELPLVGHKEAGTTATACPGVEIFNQMKAGVFEPVEEDIINKGAPLSPQDINTEEVDMRIITPKRVLDTRGGRRLNDKETIVVDAGVPGAKAVAVNLTVVDSKSGGFLTAWGEGDMPNVSNLNYPGGLICCNTSIVPLDADGKFRIYAYAGTHVLADVQAVLS